MSTLVYTSHRPVHRSETTACTETLHSGVNLSRQYASSGVRYARKQKIKHDDKDVARSRIHRLFYDACRAQSPAPRDGFRPFFVTMPGLYWSMEKQLRNTCELLGLPLPQFGCYEIDPAIFRAALEKIPGRRGVQAKSPVAVRTKKIAHFECIDVCEIEKLPYSVITGVWLDFCGPLSSRRIDAFEFIYSDCRVGALTFMKGRYDREFRELVDPHGGTLGYLTYRFGKPTDVYNYGLMMQVCWSR